MPSELGCPRSMKLLSAVIQPPKLRPVLLALEQAGVERLTVCDAQGATEQAAGGHEDRIHRKVVLEIVVNDDFVDRTLAVLAEVAKTGPAGEDGDGKVFILPIEQTIQVSDSSRGPAAV